MLRMSGVRSARIVTTFVFLLGLFLPFGCAGLFEGSSNPPSPVIISSATPVRGNEALGKISTGGLSAPSALPTPARIEVSSASGTTLSGKTEIRLEKPIPTVTAISPTAVPVGSFLITGTPALPIMV